MRRLIPKILVIVLLVLATSVLAQQRKLRIGIIYDGYQPDNRRATELLTKEVREVMLGDIEISFPAEKILVGDWTAPGVKGLVDQLLNDPDVDLVIGFGVFASQELASRGPLPKPSIAPAIIEPARQKIPSKGTVSGVHNLNYLKFPVTFQRDVKFFRELVPFQELTILAGKKYFEGVPALRMTNEEMEQLLGVKAETITVDTLADEILAQIPPDAEAIYFHPSLYLAPPEFVKLVEGINRRRLPSFSYFGESEVTVGVFASLNPDILPRIIRRIALNVHRIYDGEDPADLPTDFPAGRKLYLNFNTALKIGVLPSWSTLLDAELLFPDTLRSDLPRVTIGEAVKLALNNNLSIAGGKQSVFQSKEDVTIARANLLPHLDLSGNISQIDEDRAVGLNSERFGSLSGTLTQVVFSESALANLSIQSSLARSDEEVLEQTRLDVIFDVLDAYFNHLRARRSLFILLENLRVTRRNLEVARNRDITGVAEPGEPLRWESEIASNRMDVMAAHSRMMQAQFLLSQVLHHSMEDEFVTLEVTLEDPHFLTSKMSFRNALDKPFDFQELSTFLVGIGISNSPEVRQLEELIAAQERSLTSYRLSHFVPTVSAFGERTENLYRGGRGADVDLPYDDTDWIIGLKLSLPIFSGFSTKAATNKARHELSNLQIQRDAVVERIELNVRSQMQNVKSAYFGINQSQLAAEAAQKNYEIVADSYTEGSVPIVSLLDAQSVLLSANQVAANAYYAFLIEFVKMERSIGQFGLVMTVDEVTAFEAKMIDFMSSFQLNQ